MTRCGYPYASVLGLMTNHNAFVVCDDNLATHQIGTRLNVDMRSNASCCCGLDAPLANPSLALPNGLSYSWPPTYKLSNYERDLRYAATLISFHSKLVCHHESRVPKEVLMGLHRCAHDFACRSVSESPQPQVHLCGLAKF